MMLTFSSTLPPPLPGPPARLRPAAPSPTPWLRQLCLLGLLVLGWSASVQAQVQTLNTDLIMGEISRPHGDLVQVCAHRGLFSPGTDVPENSLPAIAAAAKAGIEAVELDIKVTKNGVPILMHDPGVQRTTDFDFALAKTPFVSDLYWALPGGLYPKNFVLSGVRLRQNNPRNSANPFPGKVAPAFLPSLEEALTYIRDQDFSMVVVLDLKDVAALKACLPIVHKYRNGFNNPFDNSVIFKLDGKDLSTQITYNDIKSTTGNKDFHFMLRFNTTSIIDQTKPETIYAAHRNNGYFMGIEAVSKAVPLALEAVMDAALIDNKAVWNYYPLPELANKRYFWFGPNSPQGDGTYKTQDIIDVDNAKFAAAKFSIREFRDNREDAQPNDGSALPFLLDDANASGLTYDDPVGLISKLRAKKLRREERYKNGFGARPSVLAARPSAPLNQADQLALELFPNPASNSFTVRYQSPLATTAHLTLRSLTGQVVSIKDAPLRAGPNEVSIETHDLAPGYYALSLTTGPTQVVKKVLITR